MKKVETQNYVRISKAEARARYYKGLDVCFVPCKIHPENKWGIGFTTNFNDEEFVTFENFLLVFTWFNCNNYNNIYGRYPAYYKRKGE